MRKCRWREKERLGERKKEKVTEMERKSQRFRFMVFDDIGLWVSFVL